MPMPPMLWHAHEMLYGFAAAVIVGFLLTAGKAWTGQPTPRGLALGALALLSHYQIIPAHLAISVVPREICLLIVALGIFRIYITFLINVLLARRSVPRIVTPPPAAHNATAAADCGCTPHTASMRMYAA